jgi:hypothetical protein
LTCPNRDSIQAWSPGGAPELLGDGHPGEELVGGVRAHLRAVVRERQQQWLGPVDGGREQPFAFAAGQRLAQCPGGGGVGGDEQVLGEQGRGEGDIDLTPVIHGGPV